MRIAITEITKSKEIGKLLDTIPSSNVYPQAGQSIITEKLSSATIKHVVIDYSKNILFAFTDEYILRPKT